MVSISRLFFNMHAPPLLLLQSFCIIDASAFSSEVTPLIGSVTSLWPCVSVGRSVVISFKGGKSHFYAPIGALVTQV